ncbi:hypothetical protein DIPPA_06504 [Diplonema papillatum]|nr:hypothetical protein DIPPA_06504 [Diplonema papillatum]
MSFCLTNHFVLENVAEVCKSQDVRDWLENDDTEVAYTTIGSSPYLAVAHKSEVVVIQLGQKAVGGVLKEKARVPYKRLMFLPLEGTVASMRWVRPSKSRSEPPLLAVGTDKGVLVLISYRAAVLHRQQLRTERVVSVKEKTKGKPCGEDLLVLTAPNHLFHFDTTHLSRLLDPRYLEPANDNRGTPAFHAQATTVPLFSVFPAFSRDGLPCTIHQLKPAAKTPVWH